MPLTYWMRCWASTTMTPSCSAKGVNWSAPCNCPANTIALKLLQRSLKDLAATPVALPLDQVRLDADRRNHLPIVVPDRIGLLNDRRSLGWRLPPAIATANLGEAPAALRQRPHHVRLVGKAYLPPNQRLAVDGQDRVRPGLGHHHRSFSVERAIHERRRPGSESARMPRFPSISSRNAISSSVRSSHA